MLLNLVKHQRSDVDKFFLYVKVNESINCLSKEKGNQELNKQKNSKAFIDYSQTIDAAYKNIEDYNSTNKRRVLIVFDDMIAYKKANKN